MQWEVVIGLETHVQLSTRSKIFSGAARHFGDEPNVNACYVDLALPGSLPVLNHSAVEKAIRFGLAIDATVANHSVFDRKNYFYPDLPKAYQISQFDLPLCSYGWLDVETEAGSKRIGITRIHIEEDAGKLLHDEANGTALDMNRCGVPLIEIVSEPDIRSAEEAVAYLRKLRAILTYTGVSDCRMNEGSMRCDVNLSVRRPGEPFGVRTEMKNLNSFQSVERAIEAEYRRQVEALETGEGVVQETRRYDQKTGKTTSMRRKENSADYRYFPDPDLPEIYLSDAEMAEIRASIPALPDERRMRYMQQYGLTAYAAEQLTAERWLAEYFERAAGLAESPVALCNLILGEVFAQITLRDTAHTGERGPEALPIAPEHLAALSDMIGTGKVNSSTGKKILATLFDRDQDPVAYAQAHDLFTLTDPAVLEAAARETLEKNPDMVKTYLSGKTTVEKALMGKAMALTRGKADPEALRRKLLELLGKQG